MLKRGNVGLAVGVRSVGGTTDGGARRKLRHAAAAAAPHRPAAEGLEGRTLFAAFLVDTTADDGPGSLRAAVTSTNFSSGSDTITFDAALSGETITLTTGELSVNGPVRITGPGSDDLTISGGGASRVFNIALPPVDPADVDELNPVDAVVAITGLTLADGSVDGSGSGGAVSSTGAALALDDVTIRDSVATGYGGGLYVGSSDLDGDPNTFDAAYASGLTVTDSTISGNAAALYGGGIFVSGVGSADVVIRDTEVSGNEAGASGGGIYADSYQSAGRLVLDGVTLADNTAGYDGGGMYVDDTGDRGVLITNSVVTGNTAEFGTGPSSDSNGGGVYIDAPTGEVVIRDTVFTDNSAEESGGGLYIYDAADRVTLERLRVTGNTAGSGGGGIYANEGDGPFQLRDSTIDGNTVGTDGEGYGGGLYIDEFEQSVLIERTTISNNEAAGGGGGVFMYDAGSPVTFLNSTISGNGADNNGGGAYIYSDVGGTGRIEFSNTTVADNTAGNQGGGIFSLAPTSRLVRLTSALVADNAAPAGPDLSGPYQLSASLVESGAGAALTGSGNQVGVAPLLGPLADNGGRTFTHALLAGSPAIDKGSNPQSLISDQRGRTRTVGAGTDVGAYESSFVPPSLKVSDVTANEGNTGTKTFAFTVTLSQAAAGTVTVHYATGGGNATVGNDYVAASGNLTFLAGQTSKTVNVTVKGDTLVESDNTFNLVLSAPTGGATIADGTGVGKIVNDDPASPPPPPPAPALSKISVGGFTATEGDSGFKLFTFKVTLDKSSASAVTVKYATANGTGSSATDYQATSGTLTFAAGQTTKDVTVKVFGDTLVEGENTFFVNLSAPTNATIAVSKGTGRIVNDD